MGSEKIVTKILFLLKIFNIYNQNILEKNFFSKKKIQFNEHKDWFKKTIKKKRL